MRSISIEIPSGTLKMTLWENTEDERRFPIKALHRKPYVLAYGIKYFLTEEEIKMAKDMIGLCSDYKHMEER